MVRIVEGFVLDDVEFTEGRDAHFGLSFFLHVDGVAVPAEIDHGGRRASAQAVDPERMLAAVEAVGPLHGKFLAVLGGGQNLLHAFAKFKIGRCERTVEGLPDEFLFVEGLNAEHTHLKILLFGLKLEGNTCKESARFATYFPNSKDAS